jgi:hypothetical protein
MTKKTIIAALVTALVAGAAWAKIPPPPPPDPAAAEAKKEKDKADAEKAKADLTAAEDRAVKNYQSNMRKMGKPVPKPVPVVAKSEPPKGGSPAPESNTLKAEQKAKADEKAKKEDSKKPDAKKS